MRIPVSITTGPWLRRLLPLARSKRIPADFEEVPGGVFLLVRISAAATREEVFELLDGAVDLVERATGEESTELETLLVAERHAREWWDAQRR